MMITGEENENISEEGKTIEQFGSFKYLTVEIESARRQGRNNRAVLQLNNLIINKKEIS